VPSARRSRDLLRHGATFADLVEFCLAMVPEARAMRSHDLFGCSSLFALIVRSYSQIATDCSIFLPGGSCAPVIDYHGVPAGRITRVPFSFADNVAARRPGWRWDAEPAVGGGLTVFDFHPSLIALNLGEPAGYDALKGATAARPLQATSREDFAPFVNPNAGARTYLRHLLEGLAPADCATISAFAAAHTGGDSP
jgi:hypothetical protein